MINPKNISAKEYNYTLPEDKIAKYPLNERDASNLLIYDQGRIKKEIFRNIPDYIQDDYLLVFNNAEVVYSRLKFKKETGAKIEIFCLEPIEPQEYNLAFQSNQKTIWRCLVGNLKKWKTGELKKEISVNEKIAILTARKKQRDSNYVDIEFSWDNQDITFSDILDHSGIVPIPPYLKRDSEKIDKTRYQTIYSRVKGSVAAPTAGLHFTKSVMNKLKENNIPFSEITLHVGAGTFRPVKAETVAEHEMHTEHFSVSLKTIEELIKNQKRILAIGTTSVRTLESLYWLGQKINNLNSQKNDRIKLNQWDHLELPSEISLKESLKYIAEHLKVHQLESLNASTQIMITPGYQFKVIDAMVTNFHQPQSTLLMLIAAFVGEDWEKIYEFALNNNFRFLSYGDSSLLFPKK
jgi:S-adenosylmethionine:tRNA ribosyltransferase-isomerase